MSTDFSNSKAPNPIGIFDSGVGGTSIWKQIHESLPNEDVIYLADSKNAPYGNKTAAKIIELSKKNTDLLLKKKCKIIVVACNTATTNAIKTLRGEYSVPFIGIEPAIKPASLNTKTKSIGILATKGTLTSDLFHKTVQLHSKGVTVIEQEGIGLVELIEANKIETEEMRELLSKYLHPMIKANIDHLVLGCSHYPYLIPILKKILPTNVKVIDSGLAVAQQTKSVLRKDHLLNLTNTNPSTEFYTNGIESTLKQLVGSSYKTISLNF